MGVELNITLAGTKNIIYLKDTASNHATQTTAIPSLAVLGLTVLIALGTLTACGKGFAPSRVSSSSVETRSVQSFDSDIQTRINNGNLNLADFGLSSTQVDNIKLSCKDTNFNPLNSLHSAALGVGKSGVLYMIFIDLCDSKAPSVNIFIEDPALGDAIILESIDSRYMIDTNIDTGAASPIYLLEFPLFYQYLDEVDWQGQGNIWVSAQNDALEAKSFKHEAISINQPLQYSIAASDFAIYGPHLSKPLNSFEVIEGQALIENNFCARVDAFHVQYRWITAGALAPHSNNSNECYLIDQTNAADESDYSVDFIMGGKLIISSATQKLRVNLAGVVTLTELPETIAKDYGTNIEVDDFCITAAGTNISYAWSRLVANEWITLAGQANRCLSHQNLAFIDAGDYRVTVSNTSQIDAVSNGYIEVLNIAPDINLSFENNNLQLGEDQILADNVFCVANGTGTNLAYTWEFKGTAINATFNSIDPQSATGRCFTNPVGHSDSAVGTYRVIAANSRGTSNSFEANLGIIYGEAPPLVQNNCEGNAIDQDSIYDCQLRGTDINGDAITWALQNTDSQRCMWIELETRSDGFTYATGLPNDDDVGSCTLSYTGVDGNFHGQTYIVPVIVANISVQNLVPSFEVIDLVTIVEDPVNTLLLANAEVQANEEGFGNYTLDDTNSFTPLCNSLATVGSVTVDPNTGAINFLPVVNWNGNCFLTLTFSDNNGSAVAEMVEVLVTPENDAPVIAIPSNAGMSCFADGSGNIQCIAPDLAEGGSYSFTPAASDIDSVNEVISWSLDSSSDCINSSGDELVTFGTSTGSIAVNPKNNDITDCHILIYATDSSATRSNGFMLDFKIVNRLPTIDAPGKQTVLEETMLTLGVNSDAESFGGTYLVDTSAADQSGMEYCHNHGTVSLTVNGVNGATNDGIDTGDYTFMPTKDYVGNCLLVITINDGNVENFLNSIEVDVEVLNVNDAPTLAANCTTTGTAGQTYTCVVTATDPDPLSNLGSTPTIAVTDPSHTCNAISSSATAGSKPNETVLTISMSLPTANCELAFHATQDGAQSNTLTTSIGVSSCPSIIINSGFTSNLSPEFTINRGNEISDGNICFDATGDDLTYTWYLKLPGSSNFIPSSDIGGFKNDASSNCLSSESDGFTVSHGNGNDQIEVKVEVANYCSMIMDEITVTTPR